MLIKKNFSKGHNSVVGHNYDLGNGKTIHFLCRPSNEVIEIELCEKYCGIVDSYTVKGLLYMECFTPEDEGEIDVIDTDKLIQHIRFDEMEVTC